MPKIVKAGLAAIEDGCLLLVREEDRDTLFIPGGKPEPGETIEQALAREIQEELGTALVPGSVRFYRVFEGPAAGRPGTTVELHLHFGKLASAPRAGAEIAELVWFGVDEDWGRLSPIARQFVIPRLVADGHLSSARALTAGERGEYKRGKQ